MVGSSVPSERFATSNGRASESHRPALHCSSISSRALGKTNVLMMAAVESVAIRTSETQLNGYGVLSLLAS